jgi:hypothetical protein|tara:strand:+ start:456 stop:704 length:249 start_codon:yes stop_codon:yes gene_type:complete
MTKAQLQSELYSAKLELEHVIKQLQFRVDFQKIEKLEVESDHDMHYAKKAGALEAWAHMSNNDMSIAIKNLTKVVKDLDNCK